MRVHKIPEGYYARVGDFFGKVAENPSKALEALDKELEAYHPLDHTYVRCVDGTVLHVGQTPSHGFNIYVIPPTGYKGEGVGVQGTRQVALTRALELAVTRFGGLVK